MTLKTFADELPVRGSEAPLITAAIAAAYPKSLSELGRDAGISKFAASRAAADLISSGLLVDTPDGYVFNSGHPLAEQVTALAWHFSGVQRPTDDSYIQRPLRRAGADEFHYRHRGWIPDSLSLEGGYSPHMFDGTGPSLVTARQTCDWIDATHPRLRLYEQAGQDVFALWSNERLRDMVHQTLHFGQALSAARSTLADVAGPEAQGGHAADAVSVPAAAWARATYLIAAELRDVLRVMRILDTAIWVGWRVNGLREDAIYHLHQVNYAGRDSDFTDQRLDDALEAESQADRLWTDESYGPYKRIGGIPRERDVGTAGDQILAVLLHNDATGLASQVQSMASHPALQTWTQLHPDEAHTSPLCSTVPEVVLRSPRDWPEQPPAPGAGPSAE